MNEEILMNFLISLMGFRPEGNFSFVLIKKKKKRNCFINLITKSIFACLDDGGNKP